MKMGKHHLYDDIDAEIEPDDLNDDEFNWISVWVQIMFKTSYHIHLIYLSILKNNN